MKYCNLNTTIKIQFVDGTVPL